MSEGQSSIRLSKAAREFNIGISTVLEFLNKKGFKLDRDPNAKLSQEMYILLMSEFASEKHVKEEAKKIGLQFGGNETVTIADKRDAFDDQDKEMDDLMIKNVSLGFGNKPSEVIKKEEPPKEKEAPRQVKPVIVETKPTPPEKKDEETKKEKVTEVVAKKEVKEEPVAARVEEMVSEPGEIPAAEEIKPEHVSSLKILGKMELPEVTRKGSRKGKEKKQTEKPDAKVIAKPEAPVAEEVPIVDLPPDPIQEEVPPVEPVEMVEEIPPPPPKIVVPDNFLATERIKLEGPTILGSMILPETRKPDKKQPVASSSDDSTKSKKKKRKRIKRQPGEPGVNVQPDVTKRRPGESMNFSI